MGFKVHGELEESLGLCRDMHVYVCIEDYRGYIGSWRVMEDYVRLCRVV